MKKIFVSQPLRGLNEEESKSARTIACKMAIEKIADKYGEKAEDLEIIDSFFKDYSPDKGCIPLKYLSKSIELLADADYAYFGEGWELARGCKIEHACAEEYGIKTVESTTFEREELMI